MTQTEEITVVETLPYVPTSSSIVTKLPVERDRTPANVGVVGDRLLAEQGALTLGDALVNVSRRQRRGRAGHLRLLRPARLRRAVEWARAHRRRAGARGHLLPALQRRACRGVQGPGGVSLRQQPARRRRQPGAAAAGAGPLRAPGGRGRQLRHRRRRGGLERRARRRLARLPSQRHVPQHRRLPRGEGRRAHRGEPGLDVATERALVAHPQRRGGRFRFPAGRRPAADRRRAAAGLARRRLRVRPRPLRAGRAPLPGRLPDPAHADARAAQQGVLPRPRLGLGRHVALRRLVPAHRSGFGGFVVARSLLLLDDEQRLLRQPARADLHRNRRRHRSPPRRRPRGLAGRRRVHPRLRTAALSPTSSTPRRRAADTGVPARRRRLAGASRSRPT